MREKMKRTKVCHMTSAHISHDVRILHKECVSLTNAGYEVYLVAHGEKEKFKGVNIIGIGEKPASRIKRMLSETRKVYKEALKLNCDIYHFHDPELLPYGKKLAAKGKRVIFDSHEDYASTIECKEYIPKCLRKLLQLWYKKYEKYICKKCSGVIACYHWTETRCKEYCENTELVFNYPITDDAMAFPGIITENEGNTEITPYICYAGGIDSQWNHKTVIRGLESLGAVRYVLAGSGNCVYINELQSMPGWKNVRFEGRIPFEKVRAEIYRDAVAGVALLDYIPQCKGTIGNLSNTKLFEYMYNGLPVICTNFQLWKKIIEEEECGICINPRSEREFADAVKALISNPDRAVQMGMNGKKAVLQKYNWECEERKLLKLYKQVEQ